MSQEDAYLLGPGDGLQLRFFGATELSGPVEVLSDGNVSLPLLGPVRVELPLHLLWGKTPYRRSFKAVYLGVLAPLPVGWRQIPKVPFLSYHPPRRM